MIKIALFGASGRMGQRIAFCSNDNPDLAVCGALDVPGNPAIGRDMGELCGIGKINVPIVSEPAEALKHADVVIDFTFHEATIKNLALVAEKKKALVIGTTGFCAEEIETIHDYAEHIPILLASNMSLGVNLLFSIAGKIAASLGDGYDIEIIEAHHNQKKDAPSGTARTIAEEIAAALKRDYRKDAVHGRHGIVGERKPNEIGMHAVRGGDIVGDHTILYAGPCERIELKHQAHSRDVFARGALKAAKFLARQTPGMYTMHDVLGI